MRGRRRSILALGLLFSCVYPTLPATASETVNYTYDSQGRLITVSRSGDVNNGVSSCYAYDKANNRSNVTVATSACPSQPPSFSVSNVTAAEGAPLTFTVTRSGSTSGTFTVDYGTSNGTATVGSDYTASSGTLTFAGGEAAKTFDVTTINDLTPEGSETVTATLSNASGGAAITDGQGTGTISASDAIIRFAISDAAIREGAGGLIFTVIKVGDPKGASYSVSYNTAPGTASAGADYTSKSGQLTFAPFETSKTITIPAPTDGVAESAETVLINLSGATGGAIIKRTQGVGTIYDAQTLTGPRFVVSDTVGGEGGQASFTVTSVGTPTASASIQYTTANGTALAGTHYTATNYQMAGQGSLYFNGTTTSLKVHVPIIDNGPVVDGKYFYLNISSSSGAVIIDAQAIGTIYDDD